MESVYYLTLCLSCLFFFFWWCVPAEVFILRFQIKSWLRFTCICVVFSSVQSLSRVRLLATPWIAACQASLSITNSGSSLRLTSIESVMPSSHLILGHALLLLPPIPPSIRVFSNESTLHMRWPKYWHMWSSCLTSDGTQPTCIWSVES